MVDMGSVGSIISNLGTEIVAIGALGTAAFGLVDSFKALPGGGISRSGFKFIRAAIVKLTPPVPALDKTELSQKSILYALQSQWINGVEKGNQISIAKSLIKLRLTPDTAPALAAATGVNAELLKNVATKIQEGKGVAPNPQKPEDPNAFSTQEFDVYGRFDLLLNTLLDQAYQRADQRYRNAARAAAVPVAVVLALVAGRSILGNDFFYSNKVVLAVLMGLISTPIAPVAKDIASALSTAAQAFQFGKK
jgi:hypothetical protein